MTCTGGKRRGTDGPGRGGTPADRDPAADIERLPPGDPEREDKLRRAFALIRQDIRDEEDLLLPRLQDAMDTARLRKLGTTWAAVRQTASTHPHPVIPRRPYWVYR
ncbi:hypothetical protein ACWC3X_42275 [Streptomyces populi]